MASTQVKWIGTPEACARLGVTLRTLYRFIDEGQLPAYKMGRVIRLQAHEVDAFIERARIVPGTLEHLYPDPRTASPETAEAGEAEEGNHEEALEAPAPRRARASRPAPSRRAAR